MSSRAEASRSDAAAEGSRPGTGCEPYVCLPENVASVDEITGQVRAGNGKYPDTFAIGMLSVGDHVATYPIVFKRSPSFIVNPAVGFPAIPSPPTETGTGQAPPPPPPPPTPDVPSVDTPEVPVPPPVPPIAASQPPEPQPPAPPAPPPPTEQLSPLSLALAPPSITIATPTAVIQPPTPPVNPAPPGGARREARQRQAAAQKSGADNAEEGSDGQKADLGDSPPSAHGTSNMTRHALDPALGRSETRALERRRAEPSFTSLSRASEPSAGAQALLYTGGLTLLAAALAAGWSRGRPTPGQRPPEVPAPALARVRSRR